MNISGNSIIGNKIGHDETASFSAINPATAQPLEPCFREAGAAEVTEACALAAAAFDSYRETDLQSRATFLESIAEQILSLDDELLQRASKETGLPTARIETERDRTVGQLRLFATMVRQGSWLDARIDPALPDRKPLPRPDLRPAQHRRGPGRGFRFQQFFLSPFPSREATPPPPWPRAARLW